MKKSRVLALVSLFFVASVVSFPLNEPVTSSLTTDYELNHDLVDDFEDGSLSDDVDTENNDKIEDFVLGQPMPKQVTSGSCYQQCKKTTPTRCTKAVHNDVKKFTIGELNFCIAECKVVNTNCFKRY